MPDRSVFTDYPDVLKQLEQAMQTAQAKFNADQVPYSTIAAWLTNKWLSASNIEVCLDSIFAGPLSQVRQLTGESPPQNLI